MNILIRLNIENSLAVFVCCEAVSSTHAKIEAFLFDCDLPYF